MLSEQAQKCIDEKLAMNLVATFRDPEVFEAAVESCRPKALEGGQIDIPDPVKEEADFSESRAEDGTRMFRLAPKEYVENAQDTLEIIYIHGGGFLFGIGPVHFLLALRLMKELGCAVTLPVYPTLPEAKYSAILSSAMTAYKTVREEHPEARIALTGDSAGGNLCIAVSMECRDHGIAQPNLIVPFSPFIDLEGTVAKREGFDPDDPLLDWYGSAQIARLLVEDGEKTQAYPPDPFFGSTEGLAAMLVFTGTREELYPGIRDFAQKAKEAGCDVELVVEEGLHHAFLLDQGNGVPEIEKCMNRVIERMKTC